MPVEVSVQVSMGLWERVKELHSEMTMDCHSLKELQKETQKDLTMDCYSMKDLLMDCYSTKVTRKDL